MMAWQDALLRLDAADLRRLVEAVATIRSITIAYDGGTTGNPWTVTLTTR